MHALKQRSIGVYGHAHFAKVERLLEFLRTNWRNHIYGVFFSMTRNACTINAPKMGPRWTKSICQLHYATSVDRLRTMCAERFEWLQHTVPSQFKQTREEATGEGTHLDTDSCGKKRTREAATHQD